MPRRFIDSFLLIFFMLLHNSIFLVSPVFALSDGSEWTEAGTNTLPTAVSYGSSVIFDGKIWVIGGYNENWDITRKVYYSTNGSTWYEAGSNSLLVGTENHTSIVYDGNMWVIGGFIGGGGTRKVYYSTNGSSWTEAGNDALPVAVSGHSSLVYNGKMWMIGDSRKVYYSTNGSSWTEAGTDALPESIDYHSSLVYDGKMWVIGGFVYSGGTRKVYYSTNGSTWYEAGTDALPIIIIDHTSVVFDNKMWIIGGGDWNNNYRKVYYSTDNITPTPTPTTSTQTTTSNNTSSVYSPSCSDQKPSNSPNLFQIDTTESSAKLFFAPVFGSVNKYFISYGLTNNAEGFGIEFSERSSTGVLSYTINSLSPNTTYYFKIRAGNGCMPGDWGNTLKTQTKTEKMVFGLGNWNGKENEIEKNESGNKIEEINEEIKENFQKPTSLPSIIIINPASQPRPQTAPPPSFLQQILNWILGIFK